MFVVFIVLFLAIIYFQIKGNKPLALFFLVNLTFGFGFINPKGGPIEVSHLLYIVIVVITLLERYRNREYFALHNDNIGKVVICIGIYYLLHLLFSIVVGVDSFKNCLNSGLGNIIWLVYFYFRSMDASGFKKFFKMIICLSVIQGIFYYLQFIGFTGILTGKMSEGVGGDVRFYNQPFWSMLILLYLLVVTKKEYPQKYLLLIFFLPLPIFSQGRGVLIALAGSLCIYMLIKRQKKNVLLLFAGVLFFQFVVSPMFSRREKEADKNTFQEISEVLRNPSATYTNYEAGSGTLVFRIGMLTERITYLLDNPQYLLFGVGDVYENSSNNTYIFNIGTYNTSAQYGKTMLSSVDIDWVEPTIKYGLVGVFLYILLYFTWGSNGLKAIKKNDNRLLLTSTLYCYYCFFSSFGTSPLHRRLFIALFCMAIVSQYRRNKKLIS